MRPFCNFILLFFMLALFSKNIKIQKKNQNVKKNGCHNLILSPRKFFYVKLFSLFEILKNIKKTQN